MKMYLRHGAVVAYIYNPHTQEDPHKFEGNLICTAKSSKPELHTKIFLKTRNKWKNLGMAAHICNLSSW